MKVRDKAAYSGQPGSKLKSPQSAVVAGLRLDRQPPRVLGMVVELITRRRIFVPMLRVTSLEANAVTLATGTVNLRHFHQRPNEVMVLGELLDARVSRGR